MSHRAIWFLFDGLSARYLGCQGNTWIDTMNFDRWAAAGQSIEFGIADSPAWLTAVQSFIEGRHSAFLTSTDSVSSIPLQRLRDGGVRCALLSDDPRLSGNRLYGDWFDDVIDLHGSWPTTSAASIGDAHLAHCLGAALDVLAQQPGPAFCLIALASLTRVWDAPYQMRANLVDEDDPPPPHGALPWQMDWRGSDIDPDEILGITRAYAAQVQLLDQCLGVFMDQMAELGLVQDTFFGLSSARGYPLGEHGIVGYEPSQLFGETMQVPLLVRMPQSEFESARHHVLAQPSQAMATVVSWFHSRQGSGVEPPPADDLAGMQPTLWPILHGQRPGGNGDSVIYLDEQQSAVWTPAWKMVETPSLRQLFVRPDDRWEVNPVDDRCPQIVGTLSDLLADCRHRVSQGQSVSRIPLADELMHGIH